MKPGAACAFFFTGAAVLPPFLAFSTDPGLAAIACMALLLAGAVCGIADPDAPHRGVRGRNRPPD